MSTTHLFIKHFGGRAAVNLTHLNIEVFFEELNRECVQEDKNKGTNGKANRFPDLFQRPRS